jgi:hypothetical protein
LPISDTEEVTITRRPRSACWRRCGAGIDRRGRPTPTRGLNQFRLGTGWRQLVYHYPIE